MGVGGSCSAGLDGPGVLVGKIDDFPPNSLKEVKINNGRVLIANYKGQLYAVGSKCTHYGASLSKGVLVNGPAVKCPWHGAKFCLTTGDIEEFPGLNSIPTYKVKVKGENVIVWTGDLIKDSMTPPLGKMKNSNVVFLIIGAGAAGTTAAQTLRQRGFEGRVVMITQDQHLPYDRTKLSKFPGREWEEISLRPEIFFQEHDIEVMTKSEVDHVDFDNNVVTVTNNEEIKFNKLLIATGVRPRELDASIPGFDLFNIIYLYSIKDSKQIKDLAEGKSLVIVGSSFIAMELASALKDKCKEIDILSRSQTPYGGILGIRTGVPLLKRLLKEENIRFHPSEQVEKFEGNSSQEVTSVITKKNLSISCNLVVVAIGAVPNTLFLQKSPIILDEKSRAVVVNKEMETNINGVYAAGDVTSFPLAIASKGQASVAHWQVAQMHGKAAALSLLGQNGDIGKLIPFFWTSVCGINLRYAGYGEAFDETVIFGEPSNQEFCTLYRREKKIIAIATVGCDPLCVTIADLMEQGQEWIDEFPQQVLDRFPNSPTFGQVDTGDF